MICTFTWTQIQSHLRTGRQLIHGIIVITTTNKTLSHLSRVAQLVLMHNMPVEIIRTYAKYPNSVPFFSAFFFFFFFHFWLRDESGRGEDQWKSIKLTTSMPYQPQYNFSSLDMHIDMNMNIPCNPLLNGSADILEIITRMSNVYEIKKIINQNHSHIDTSNRIYYLAVILIGTHLKNATQETSSNPWGSFLFLFFCFWWRMRGLNDWIYS